MTLTPTYDSVLSRVRVVVTGLVSGLTVHIERSTDQVTWTTVRGGTAVPVATGTARIDDYEFAPNVANYYRATGASPINLVAACTAAHADNASVAPTVPAGTLEGHLMLMWASIRNTSATPTTHASWTLLGNNGCARLYGRIASATEPASYTQAFSGGAAGSTTSAQIATFDGASITVHAGNLTTNASAQNITTAALTVTEDGCLVVQCGQKEDDWTSVATLSGYAEIGEPSSTTGNDQGIVWDWAAQSTATNVGASSFVVTGGVSAAGRSVVMALLPNTLVQTASVTPNLTSAWIKNLFRPFLNRAVDVIDYTTVDQPARNSLFDVIGRSYPVAVTDVRGSRRVTLRVKVDTLADAEDLRLCLAAGDPVFVQVPADCPVPGSMYAVIGDLSISRTSARGVKRYFELPLTEVAAPAADVAGSTITWQGVINAYATWQDVIDAEATWADLMEGIGSPSDVIVP